MGKTTFDMRANLKDKEPKLVKYWEDIKLYETLEKDRQGCEEYLLHDGPPYANGDIHCGHMLNRLLKDFAVRHHLLKGEHVPFIFGWDTHGLPIEVQVNKTVVDRKTVSPQVFREECEKYALKQVAHQKEQIKRLGAYGDYLHPYMTLQKEYEARQIDVFKTLALKGIIYKGVKPVYWSPSSESALAEAEVEYKDVTAKTLYVYFPFKKSKYPELMDAGIVIWTTTPWTIPADLAVTLNPSFTYGLFKTDKGKMVFLEELKDTLKETLGLKEVELLKTYKGQELEYSVLTHPLYENRESLVIINNYVTKDTGTGCVHTAPDHGVDDFNAGMKYGLKPFCPVDEKGIVHFKDDPLIDGKFYEDTNDIVIKELEEKGRLLKEIDIVHSYPHDWRTHLPVIFRATPQWFCSINPIKNQLLDAVSKIKWVPAWGEEKMKNMIKDRTDWCISRQRSWGVPLPIIYNEDGSPIIEEEVFDKISEIFRKEGSGAWFTHDASYFLPEGYKNSKSPNNKFTKEKDIMDVWFDSGSSWNGVIKERGLKYPADCYLEGNDQYRGWFNASLILSVAVTGEASFKQCVTHGWVMDENWSKMSKSKGNGIDPSKVANEFGADLLRLYVSSVNYQADCRISEKIISSISDEYRKIRNTFRFLLLNYEKTSEVVDYYPLDKWVVGSLEKLEKDVLKSYDDFAFPSAHNLLANYMVTLSSFYLDVTKDILYCEPVTSLRRKSVNQTYGVLLKTLNRLFAPILSFTMEEVYQTAFKDKASLFLEKYEPLTSSYYQETKDDYARFLKIRDLVLRNLEDARNNGVIGRNTEAKVILTLNEDDVKLLSCLGKEELERALSVGEIELKTGEENVEVSKSTYEICPRCRLPKEKMVDTPYGKVCERCAKALEEEDDQE